VTSSAHSLRKGGAGTLFLFSFLARVKESPAEVLSEGRFLYLAPKVPSTALYVLYGSAVSSFTVLLWIEWMKPAYARGKQMKACLIRT
jgi:hypothetical protein